MRRFYLIGFLVLLALDTLAQLGFKFAAVAAEPLQLEVAWLGRIATERWVYVAVAGYLGAFVTWMTLLRYAPIGPAFAATHLDIVTVLIVSVTWLGETLSRAQLVGAILILTGVIVLALTKDEAPERGRYREDAA